MSRNMFAAAAVQSVRCDNLDRNGVPVFEQMHWSQPWHLLVVTCSISTRGLSFEDDVDECG